jgi:hypothetical protein
MVVAVTVEKLTRLAILEERGYKNGVRLNPIGPEESKEHESEVACDAGLWRDEMGAVEYLPVSEAMAWRWFGWAGKCAPVLGSAQSLVCPGGPGLLHVLNAPSPAVTASTTISMVVADRLIGPYRQYLLFRHDAWAIGAALVKLATDTPESRAEDRFGLTNERDNFGGLR